jgi:predicted small secreted protein
MSSSKKSIVLILLACALAALSACNTAKGFGKDVEKAGDKIQDKAAH